MLNRMVAWRRLHGVAALLVKTIAVSALLSLGAAACQPAASDAGCESPTTTTTTGVGMGSMNVTTSCFAWDPSTSKSSSCPSTCPTRSEASQYLATQACGIAAVVSDGTYDSSRGLCCYEVDYSPCD